MKVKGGTITSSPGPTSRAVRATFSAAEPDVTPRACFDPQVAAEGLLELANLEDALSLLVVTVSHQDACLQDVHQFLDFLFSDEF